MTNEEIITALAMRVAPVVEVTAEEGESFHFIFQFSICPTYLLAVTEQREECCSRC